MKTKILLVLLLISLFIPLAFCQEKRSSIKADVDKAVKEALVENKNEEFLAKINNILDEKLTAFEERFEIKKENLAIKESMADRWLNILAILIAVFGVIVPIAITIFTVFISNKHIKELSKIEILRIKSEKEFAELEVLKEKQKQEFNNLKEKTERQQKEFGNLKNEMNKTLKEMKKQAAAVKESAANAAESKRKAEHSEVMSLVYSYINDKKYDKALEELDNKVVKGSYESYFYKGYIYGEQGKQEEALKMYNLAIEKNPNDSSIYYNQGVILDKQRKQEEALKMYNLAIEKNQNNSSAYNNKGVILNQQGKKEEALRMYDLAIEKNQSNLSAYNNKGILLMELEKKTEAIESLKKALEINKNNVDAYYNLTEAYLLNENVKESCDIFKKYLNSKDSYIIYNDDYQKWIQALDKAIAKGNDSKTAEEMKKLLNDSISNGKLIKKERDK
ncbi:MAG: tetratricopeptide repeat protein [Endomicrobia bacterium]|nr:tetratricopeptide repeat protein [Endomicrobiia bacterium]